MIDYPLESFVFYRSFRDAIEEMSDENKLATLLGICDYALYGVEPTLKDAMSRAVFTVARPSIDANKERRKNGKNGGRPPKMPKESICETSGFETNNHRFSKSESTETETVSETESDTGANKADKPRTRPRFIPPTVDQVREYCIGQGYHIDPALFVDFYETRGWTAGRGKMRDWKAAVRTWERRNEKGTEETPKPVKRGRLVVDESGEEVADFG